MLQREYKEKLINDLVELAWILWSSLGLSSNINKRMRYFTDIEPLIAFSLNVARYEPRLFDEMMDWIDANERIINIQRLNNIVKRESFKSIGLLNAVGDLMSARHKSIKWKRFLKKNHSTETESLFIVRDMTPYPNYGRADEVFERNGYYRGELKLRGLYKNKLLEISRNSIQVKMRLFFGVNTRADIATYIVLGGRVHPSELARKIYFSQKSVQDVLAEMHKSRLVLQIKKGKEKYYFVEREKWNSFLGNENTPEIWINWGRIFRGLETALDFIGKEREGGSDFSEYESRKAIDDFKHYIESSDLEIEMIAGKIKDTSSQYVLMNMIDAVIKALKEQVE